MSKNLLEELAYVGRSDGKIVAMCTPHPNVVADALPEMVDQKLTITLENREEAKAEWVL